MMKWAYPIYHSSCLVYRNAWLIEIGTIMNGRGFFVYFGCPCHGLFVQIPIKWISIDRKSAVLKTEGWIDHIKAMYPLTDLKIVSGTCKPTF